MDLHDPHVEDFGGRFDWSSCGLLIFVRVAWVAQHSHSGGVLQVHCGPLLERHNHRHSRLWYTRLHLRDDQ
jgi:hypothetical protein